MFASAANPPPCRATTYSPEGCGGASSHTVQPLNSRSVTVNPRVASHGGSVLVTLPTTPLNRLMPVVSENQRRNRSVSATSRSL